MTMTDVEARIQDWRRSLLAREGMRIEHADELEDHLREEMIRLQAAGLEDQETFLVAAHRIGHPASIADEFAQLDARAMWRQRWIWMLGGWLGISLLWKLNLIAASLVSAPLDEYGPPVYALVFVLGAVAFVTALAWTTRAKRGDRIRACFVRSRTALAAVAMMGCATTAVWPWIMIRSLGRSGPWDRMLWTVAIPQSLVFFAPIVALALFMWRDHGSRKSDSAA
jgi:hypothetical protein